MTVAGLVACPEAADVNKIIIVFFLTFINRFFYKFKNTVLQGKYFLYKRKKSVEVEMVGKSRQRGDNLFLVFLSYC